MCNVALSEVTAKRAPFGDIARENITARSTPRRSSPMRVQLVVENARTRVPYGKRVSPAANKTVSLQHTISLAVASVSPFELKSIALSGELCAGIMLTFPVAVSTI